MFAARSGFQASQTPASVGSVGIQLNGSSYYSGTVSSNTLSATNNQFTVAFWANQPTNNSPGRIFSAHHPTNDEEFIQVFINGFEFQVMVNVPVAPNTSSSVWDFQTQTGGTLFDYDTWYHCVFSADIASNDTTWMMVNGVNQAWTKGGSTRSRYNVMSYLTEKIAIGASTTGTQKFTGKISQLYITDQYFDLSNAANRAKFYNNGWVDMGNDGTASGLPAPFLFFNGNKTTTPQFRQNSGRTSGTYVTVPDLTATNDAGITSIVGP